MIHFFLSINKTFLLAFDKEYKNIEKKYLFDIGILNGENISNHATKV